MNKPLDPSLLKPAEAFADYLTNTAARIDVHAEAKAHDDGARVGISRPQGRMDPADFVLHDFSAAERKLVPEVLERSADATEALLRHGLAAAQNEFHTTVPATGS